MKKSKAHLAGLEPATFRLTAERANLLRHKCLPDIRKLEKGTSRDTCSMENSNGKKKRVRTLRYSERVK